MADIPSLVALEWGCLVALEWGCGAVSTGMAAIFTITMIISITIIMTGTLIMFTIASSS